MQQGAVQNILMQRCCHKHVPTVHDAESAVLAQVADVTTEAIHILDRITFWSFEILWRERNGNVCIWTVL